MLRVLGFREHRALAYGTGLRSGPRSRSFPMVNSSAPGPRSLIMPPGAPEPHAVNVPAPQYFEDMRTPLSDLFESERSRPDQAQLGLTICWRQRWRKNRKREIDRTAAHYQTRWPEGIPSYRLLIRSRRGVVLAADVDVGEGEYQHQRLCQRSGATFLGLARILIAIGAKPQ